MAVGDRTLIPDRLVTISAVLRHYWRYTNIPSDRAAANRRERQRKYVARKRRPKGEPENTLSPVQVLALLRAPLLTDGEKEALLNARLGTPIGSDAQKRSRSRMRAKINAITEDDMNELVAEISRRYDQLDRIESKLDRQAAQLQTIHDLSVGTRLQGALDDILGGEGESVGEIEDLI